MSELTHVDLFNSALGLPVPPTHVDLFSGIAGFALSASWAGFETKLFCEIDPFCQKVIAKNFPGVPIHDDIRTLMTRKEEMPSGFNGAIDLVTGGFP